MATDTTAASNTNGNAARAAAFPRLEQTFPTLTPQEIARMRRFGEIRNYRDGERLFETGKPGPGMFVVLSGHVTITQRDGLGRVTPIIDQGPGQFLAEIGQLSDRVTQWMTMNEFDSFIDAGYADGISAPGLKLSRKEVMQARHYAVLAHGLGVQAIRAAANANWVNRSDRLIALGGMNVSGSKSRTSAAI